MRNLQTPLQSGYPCDGEGVGEIERNTKWSMYFLYDIKLKDKEVALSAEELLTMFNRNISKNAELLDYLGQNNLFGIIGKARNEGVHSRFVAELLAGSFFNGYSRESTLFHFLDMLLYRAGKENKADEVNEHLRKAILTRYGLFETKTAVCELPVKEYQKKFGGNQNKTAEKDDRIDIYLRYRLLNPIAGRDTLEIFIENKVNSAEFDSQTVRYYDNCNNGGFKHPFNSSSILLLNRSETWITMPEWIAS